MSSTTRLARVLSISAAAMALAYGGAVLAQSAPASAPSVQAGAPMAAVTAPPATPAAPQVAFSAQLVEAASAFETYTRKAAAIRADFAEGSQVRAALQTGAAYHPEQLEAGQIAFAAIVALQDPSFVQGVRDRAAADPTFADQLLDQPYMVTRLAGADGAASLVAAALRGRGDPVLRSGLAVKQAAYAVQHQTWSLATVPDAAVALQQSKSLSLVRFRSGPEDAQLLIRTALEAAGGDHAAGGGSASPVVQRGLALAALAVLGKAGDGEEAKLQPLLTEVRSARCLMMSKLNLYQCLSVAGPHYEDVFCLGQHALIDTAQCVMDSAGQAPAPAALPVTLAANAVQGGPQERASLVPVAMMRVAAQK